MINKIKTLREIVEPKANKLGISFEEVVESLGEEKIFNLYRNRLLKKLNYKNSKLSTKLINFHSSSHISDLYFKFRGCKIQKQHLSIIEDDIKKLAIDFSKSNDYKKIISESIGYQHDKLRTVEKNQLFIGLNKFAINYTGYNINRYGCGGYEDEIQSYVKTTSFFKYINLIGIFKDKYIVNSSNYEEYISILKQAGFIFLEPLEASGRLGNNDRDIYAKQARKLCNSTFGFLEEGSKGFSYNQYHKENRVVDCILNTARSICLHHIIEDQVFINIIKKNINYVLNDSFSKSNIIAFMDYHNIKYKSYTLSSTIKSNEYLIDNIENINVFIQSQSNLFDVNKDYMNSEFWDSEGNQKILNEG